MATWGLLQRGIELFEGRVLPSTLIPPPIAPAADVATILSPAAPPTHGLAIWLPASAVGPALG